MRVASAILLLSAAICCQSCDKATPSTGIQGSSPYPPSITISQLDSGFAEPAGMTMDSLGNLFVMNLLTGVVNRIEPGGIYSNFAVSYGYGSAVTIGPGCNVYASYYYDGTVKRVPSGGGIMVTYASGFSNPAGICFDTAGNLYVADANLNTVTVVSPSGNKRTFVSGLATPVGLAFDRIGYLYVANRSSNSISRISSTGIVSTYAYDIATPHSLAFDSNGELYVSQSGDYLGDGNSVTVVTTDGFVYQLSHEFDTPAGVVFDKGGNLCVANLGSGIINKIVFGR